MKAFARLPVFAGVLAFGCGEGHSLEGASQSDAAVDILSEAAADRTSAPTSDAPDLPFIEIDCAPSIPEIGRFSPQCQLSDAFFADAGSPGSQFSCERIADAGGWNGSIHVLVRRLQEIVVGQPMIIGGPDPNVSVSAASGSVLMELVQTVPGSAAGAIVIEAFEPGRLMRGRFVDVTFSRYPRPPTYPCRISNSAFVAQAPVFAAQ